MPQRSERRITARTAQFQLWSALLGNRTKRSQRGEFLVQGVRPITLAIGAGWRLGAVLHDGRRHSGWACEMLARADPSAARYALDAELLTELGGKDEPPELVLVARIPPDDLDRLPLGPGFLGLVLDRPTNPGNVGTLIRSADAFGAGGVIIGGHSADPYDPQGVRASTGSLFGVPVIRQPSAGAVVAWVTAQRERGTDLRILGTDEDGDGPLAGQDVAHRPALLVIGNETGGISRSWREACDRVLSIPMHSGTASSLNAAVAGSIALYEAARASSDRTA